MQFKFLFLIITLLTSLTSLPSIAQQKITVALGDALAPWVMPKTNSGIIISLIKEALEPEGYEVKTLYYPYARRINAFRLGHVDAVGDINLKTFEEEKLIGFMSDETYAYENFAFSLKKRNFKFVSIDELASHSLMSWQGAIAHLGGEYAEMAKKNPLYRENHDQELQVKMLFLERFDVIQLDEQIFNYYRSKVEAEGDISTTQPVDKFSFFGKSPNSILFHNKKLRDAFNKGLKKLKTSGRYEKILSSHSPSN